MTAGTRQAAAASDGVAGGIRGLVLLLFFLSGACGLAYEVVWSRTLTHVFGTTAVAVGTVLAAFMSGLAIGGWLIGKAADRSRNPLLLYAWIELGVGLAALGAHFLLQRITPVYLAFYEWFGRSEAMLGVARFVLAFGLVMVPTMLMGATLPVVTRFYVKRLSGIGAGLSALYAVNTLGAVAGALLTGFVLIGVFGLNATVYLAVLGNLGVGAAAWVLAVRVPALPVADAAPPSAPRDAQPAAGLPGRATLRLLLVGLALSGFTSFAYEIYWTRSLVFLLGNSTYAVTTMLAAFLAGIALGGFLVRFLLERVPDRVALFGWIQLAVAGTAAAAVPVLFATRDADAIRMNLGAAVDRPAALFLTRFGVALLVMLVPATLLGTTFPLVGRIGVADLRKSGATVGRIYAVNTLGNVAGALLPGLVLLSWLGIQRGILVMAALNALVGLTILVARMTATPYLRWAVPAALVVSSLLLRLVPLDFQFPSEVQAPWHRVLYYREGTSATVSVMIDPDTREKSMSVDGIDIGGNGFTDFKQQLLAHLPKLLSDEVSVELSIGLGSGILVGESARHAGVRSITCVEIEPAVLEGARYFAAENHDVLDDPRLEVVLDDVANHLRIAPRDYRVVSADEKTAQEYASNGFSYSREYYELLRGRLAPGGLVIQWVPNTLPPNLYAMILRTFAGAFPHVLLWYFPPALQESSSNTLLVGTNEPLPLDLELVRTRLAAEPAAFDGIRRYGLTSAEAIIVQLAADEQAIRSAVAQALENTLDHPRYEFYSPKDYAPSRGERLATNHGLLFELRRASAPRLLPRVVTGAQDTARLEEALAAEELFLEAYGRRLAGAPDEELYARFDAALARAPWNDSLRTRTFLQYWDMAAAHRDFRTVAAGMERALSVYEKSAIHHVNLSFALQRIGQMDRAIESARRAVELAPGLVAARRTLAELLVAVRRGPEAVEHLRVVLQVEPDDVEARALLSRL